PREVKLGSVFTHTTWDKQAFPLRDPDSTTYAGAIKTAEEEFGKRIYLEAWKRGWSRAEKKVVMGAGAEWIGILPSNIFQARFSSPICITPVSTSGVGAQATCQ